MKLKADLLIRSATEDDFDEIVELDQAIFVELAYEKFVFRQLFYAHSRLFFVAEFAGHLTGFSFASYDTGSDLSWILTLGVLPNFRKQGTGKALLYRTEEELKSLGAGEVSLHVAPENKAAIDFYRNGNYVKKGTIFNFGKPGQDRIEMTKKLPEA